MNSKSFFKILKKAFGKKYGGIEGDLNWKDGKIFDGRPNLRRHVTNLPKKNQEQVGFFSSDYSGLLKELDSQSYLTYNTRAKGVNKRLEIVLTEEKK
jgi:hypothetical protein